MITTNSKILLLIPPILVVVICIQCHFIVCPDRLQPTDMLHQTICSRYVSRLGQYLIKRCHHVSQVSTLSWGLENSQCLGQRKVHSLQGFLLAEIYI